MAARRQLRLLASGVRAPEFRMVRLSGGEVSLAELLPSAPVLLAFFKISCPVCQLTFPFLDRLHKAGGLSIYGVSQNDDEDTREFNRRYGVSFPTLLDSEESGFPVSNDYGISSVPTLFQVEKTGLISKVVEGWSRRDIEAIGKQFGSPVFRQGESVPEWKAG